MSQPPSIPGVEFTNSGLRIDAALDMADYNAIRDFLMSANKAVQWWIGDWLLYGEGRGEWGETYDRAVFHTGLSKHYLKQCKSVSRAYQLCDRSHNLPWTHHLIAASLEPEARQEVLETAVAEGWSKRQMREAVRGAKGVTHDASDRVKNRITKALDALSPRERIEILRDLCAKYGVK